MTLRLKASDWRKRGSWATHNRRCAEFWLAGRLEKNDEKRGERETKRCIIYDYFSLLFTDPSLLFFLQHATSVFVFNLLVDFRYYRWKKKHSDCLSRKLHCNWHSILIMRFFFLIVYLIRAYMFQPRWSCSSQPRRIQISIIQFRDRSLAEKKSDFQDVCTRLAQKKEGLFKIDFQFSIDYSYKK